MTVRLRPMTVADLDVLFPYEKIMFGTEAWSHDSYVYELADKELRSYFVAEDVPAGDPEIAGTEPAGVLELLGSGGLLTIGDTAEILTVGVLPAARRRGVGRLLGRGLVAEARRRRARDVLLEVRVDNDAAKTLYEREGFTRMGI